MNPFGNGSDGVLNVLSGTTYLPLNTKLQYTTVNVALGATLSTNSTTGAVLYICATTSINIDGALNLQNKVNFGRNIWSVTIDGVTYSSPGVAEGGVSGKLQTGSSTSSASQNGFGGGGQGGDLLGTGVVVSGQTITGGVGGVGGPAIDNGNSYTATRTSVGIAAGSNAGIQSGGGGGMGYAQMYTLISGSPVVRGIGGAGGNTHGADGANGTGSFGSGVASYAWSGGGGGGAGGFAGRAGVHVVLKAPSITINGQVITSGTPGGFGGNGGRTYTHSGASNYYGASGGGGGGGSAGNIYITYLESLDDDDSSISMGGGQGGDSGTGGLNNAVLGGDGLDGDDGSLQITQIPPISDFSATPTTGSRPLSVSFTNLSQGADSYLWDFGDGNTSTSTNPTHSYTSVGTYTVSLEATNEAGDTTETKINYITTTVATYQRSAGGTLLFSGSATRQVTFYRSAGGTLLFSGGARAVVLRDVESIQDKTFLYKVYDEDGSYIEVWKDVISELNFTHEINSIGSTTNVELARNSDSLGVSVLPLQTESDVDILTESDQQILVATESRNQIGSGSSVDYNNRVDIYAYYGSIEPLYTEDLMEILTEDDEAILADVGSPNGRVVFTGFISDINSRYGNSETTVVQLTSYGWDLDQFPITTAYNNEVTTVPFNSVDPSNIAITAVDRFVQRSSLEEVTYTNRTDNSISLTGTTVSYTFKANTYKDVLDKTLELMPSDWFYRIGLGDNTVYFRERATTPHHLFFLGKHIKALDLKGSILDVVNNTLFTGGGEPALYVQRKQNPASRTRRGLQIMSDSRVTLDDSAEIISDGVIEQQNKVLYRTTIEILTKQYDIESISVGEVVGFRNFGNYVDGLTLQVVGLSYSPDVVQLQLETKPPTINKRLEDIRRNLTVTDNTNVPSTPS